MYIPLSFPVRWKAERKTPLIGKTEMGVRFIFLGPVRGRQERGGWSGEKCVHRNQNVIYQYLGFQEWQIISKCGSHLYNTSWVRLGVRGLLGGCRRPSQKHAKL